MFTTNQADLLYQGKRIFTAPADLEIAEAFNNKVLVFYETYKILFTPENEENINRNIMMINSDGNIIWRIENTLKDEGNTYADLYKIDGLWKAYLYRGYRYDLDIETGKISNPMFVR